MWRGNARATCEEAAPARQYLETSRLVRPCGNSRQLKPGRIGAPRSVSRGKVTERMPRMTFALEVGDHVRQRVFVGCRLVAETDHMPRPAEQRLHRDAH